MIYAQWLTQHWEIIYDMVPCCSALQRLSTLFLCQARGHKGQFMINSSGASESVASLNRTGTFHRAGKGRADHPLFTQWIRCQVPEMRGHRPGGSYGMQGQRKQLRNALPSHTRRERPGGSCLSRPRRLQGHIDSGSFPLTAAGR